MYCVYSYIMDSKTVIRMLEKDGWYKHHQKGSHCQFKHKTKLGKVTVPHPKKDLPLKTVNSHSKQNQAVEI